jgi:hypothetical protein
MFYLSFDKLNRFIWIISYGLTDQIKNVIMTKVVEMIKCMFLKNQKQIGVIVVNSTL